MKLKKSEIYKTNKKFSKKIFINQWKKIQKKKKKIYIKFKYKKILYFNIKIFIFKKSIIKIFFLYQKKIFYKKKNISR